MTEARALYSKFDAYLRGAIAAALAAGAVAAIATAFTPSANPLACAVLAAVAAVLSALFGRLSRLRVVMYADHLAVVNPLRTPRIPWADIENIDTAIFWGWKVRIWSDGRARLAFGLSQFSRYATSHGPKYDNIDRDAPKWLSRGYAELRELWQSRR